MMKVIIPPLSEAPDIQKITAASPYPSSTDRHTIAKALIPHLSDTWSSLTMKAKNKTCGVEVTAEPDLSLRFAFSHQGKVVVLAKLQWTTEPIAKGVTLATIGRPTIHNPAYRALETDLFAFALPLKQAIDHAIKTLPNGADESLISWEKRALSSGIKAFMGQRTPLSTLLAAASAEMTDREGEAITEGILSNDLNMGVIRGIDTKLNDADTTDEEAQRICACERDRLWKVIQAGGQDNDTITRLIRLMARLNDIHGLTKLRAWIWDTFSPAWQQSLVETARKEAQVWEDHPPLADGRLYDRINVGEDGSVRIGRWGGRGEGQLSISARAVLVMPRLESTPVNVGDFMPTLAFVDGRVALTPDVPGLDAGLADAFVMALNHGMSVAFDEWAGSERWRGLTMDPFFHTYRAMWVGPMQPLENVLVSLLTDLDVLAKGGNQPSDRLVIAQKPLYNGKAWGVDGLLRWSTSDLSIKNLNRAKLGGRTASAFFDAGASSNSMPIVPPLPR